MGVICKNFICDRLNVITRPQKPALSHSCLNLSSLHNHHGTQKYDQTLLTNEISTNHWRCRLSEGKLFGQRSLCFVSCLIAVVCCHRPSAGLFQAHLHCGCVNLWWNECSFCIPEIEQDAIFLFSYNSEMLCRFFRLCLAIRSGFGAFLWQLGCIWFCSWNS